MYKTLGDLKHYLERTGSHATKESRTGRIDAIPAWAQEPEQYYNSVRERYQSLADQLKRCQSDLTIIKEKLRETLPRKQFEYLQGQQTAIASNFQALSIEAASYRSLVRAAASKSWATTFYHCAKNLIDTKLFLEIEAQTAELLGRDQQEIKQGNAEMSESQRAALQRQKNRQLRRKRVRARLERLNPETYRVAYSDEKQ